MKPTLADTTGHRISVPWPVTPNTTDPNDHIRGWLERRVGHQGMHWVWDIDGDNPDRLAVTIADQRLAVEFALHWG